MMYEYHPIPKAANQAVQQALTAQEMIAPGEEALRRAAMRRRQPQDAEQLHALLMTEGDLVAGEADAPVGWLEQLAQEERALYVEPGLWICAEQRALYEAAFLQEERRLANALYEGACAIGDRRTQRASLCATSGRRTYARRF